MHVQVQVDIEFDRPVALKQGSGESVQDIAGFQQVFWVNAPDSDGAAECAVAAAMEGRNARGDELAFEREFILGEVSYRELEESHAREYSQAKGWDCSQAGVYGRSPFIFYGSGEPGERLPGSDT